MNFKLFIKSTKSSLLDSVWQLKFHLSLAKTTIPDSGVRCIWKSKINIKKALVCFIVYTMIFYTRSASTRIQSTKQKCTIEIKLSAPETTKKKKIIKRLVKQLGSNSV